MEALLNGEKGIMAMKQLRNCCSTILPAGVSVPYNQPDVVYTMYGLIGGHNDSLEDRYALMPEAPPAVMVINTISIIFGVLSILLNIIFLCATRFLKESGTAYNRFMINLSVSDVMSSMSFLLIHNWPRGPFANIDLQNDFYLEAALPYIFRSAPWMFLTSYLLTLNCLTINQYVAVCKPWRYSSLVTARTVNISLLCVWLFSSLQVIIPLIVLLVLNSFPDKLQATNRLVTISMVEMQVWMAVYTLSSIFNILLNLIVYRKIRMLKLKRRSSHVSNPEMANIKMKQQAFVTVTLLLLVCFFCRLPFPLMGIVGISLVNKNINMNSYITINAGIVLLLYLNCFADPIIYMLRTRELRKSCRSFRLRCLLCCCPQNDQLMRTVSVPLTSTTRFDSVIHRNGSVTETESCLHSELLNDSVQV